MSTEISQAARETAERIRTMSLTRSNVIYWDEGSACERYCQHFIQSYGDKLTADLRAEVARLTKERDEAVAEAFQAGKTAQAILELRGRDKFIADLRKEIKDDRGQLHAENAALSARVERLTVALLDVGFRYHTTLHHVVCNECYGNNTHKPDCKVGIALAVSTEGETK